MSQVLVGMSYICNQPRPYFIPIPFTKALHLHLSKAAKNYSAICFKFDVSNVKMSSASGSLPPDPKDFALGTDQQWKETNENLHEMLCLKYQCTYVLCHHLLPDFVPIPFRKALPRNLSDAAENKCEVVKI